LETQRNPSLSDRLPDLYRSSTPVSERRSENPWDQSADLRVGLANSQKFLSQPTLFVTALASSNTAEIALARSSVIASTAVAARKYRRWVEEGLIGEIEDPFEAVKWQ
jgi:hypothetical protein